MEPVIPRQSARSWPETRGPFPIGTLEFEVTDPIRSAQYAPVPTTTRRLYVRAWYPAGNVAGCSRRPYFTEAEVGIVPALSLALLKQPPDALRGATRLPTNAWVGAPPAAGRFPVVVFNHGYLSYPAQHTALFEHLATNGYVVLSVGHPWESGGIVYSNGDAAAGSPRILEDMMKIAQALGAMSAYAAPTLTAQLAAVREYVKVLRTTSAGWLAPVCRDDVYFVLDSCCHDRSSCGRARDPANPTPAPGGALSGKFAGDRASALSSPAPQLGGYRVVALLEPPGQSPSFAYKMDGLRTAKSSEWHHRVEQLAEIVPVTVLDTRTVTPPVVDEVRLLAKPRFRRRLVLVSSDDGVLPAVDSSGIQLRPSQLLITTERDCPRVVRELLMSFRPNSDSFGESKLARTESTTERGAYPEKANAVIGISGFLFGYVGPVGCMRLGKSLRLRGIVGLRNLGDDFTIMVEGDRTAIEQFVREVTTACPWSVRAARRVGLAGGIRVSWAEATGRFDSFPDDMPFQQVRLDRDPKG